MGGQNVLLFEIREKNIRGDHSEQYICSNCQSKSSRLVASLRYLSFSLFSLFPLKVKHGAECTSCKRTTYHANSSKFPQFGRTDKVDSVIGSFALIGLAFLAYSYSNFLHDHQEQVRIAPQIGDILFVHTTDSPIQTEFGVQLPYRMAKVVKIEPELGAVALSYSSYTYDSDNSIYRDFAGKNYLFDSYFKPKVEIVPVTELGDKDVFYDTKRSLQNVNIDFFKPISQLSHGLKQQLQQTNELTRLFKLLS